MKIERIMVGEVDVCERLRPVDESKISRLAESMDALGLQTPITVWAKPNDAFQLVAGAHRLAAANSLGWEFIDAIFTDADEIDRQLWEIDENLMRSELSPTEEAEHLAKRKELWEARANSGTDCSENKGPGRPEGFAGETAKATGTTRQQVNRAVSRAENVCKEARDILRGTSADTGAVLDRLKGMDPAEQVEAAHREVQKRQQPVSRNGDDAQKARASKIDFDVKDRAAKEVAEMIAEHVPGEWWDGIKANLYAAGANNIANALSNITGQSIMDRRYG